MVQGDRMEFKNTGKWGDLGLWWRGSAGNDGEMCPLAVFWIINYPYDLVGGVGSAVARLDRCFPDSPDPFGDFGGERLGGGFEVFD